MATLTIRIDDDFDAEPNRLAAAHRTKSELVREMLRRHGRAGFELLTCAAYQRLLGLA